MNKILPIASAISITYMNNVENIYKIEDNLLIVLTFVYTFNIQNVSFTPLLRFKQPFHPSLNIEAINGHDNGKRVRIGSGRAFEHYVLLF